MDQPNLNMRQHPWLDMVKDYDCDILYHTGKANVVTDALSRKTTTTFIRDLCMRMTMITLLLEHICEAQVEALKEEYTNFFDEGGSQVEVFHPYRSDKDV